ncbi:uncharacterized protein ASPGLDRAFT_929541 [Aspergillus glaucus CBS 516.65]|uniref:Uncharacterized protein n=1 Tax=Aspergillus glaucus CBS 516.65 TaxID=1160497 RepID=A0A1L9V7N9_ASPGL|nr:hypothetical protein ASPGLDRAFT_929541 [Aspergillus glaucus CBS 516.65]OJJ79948.1 hypothetical protein ASPGLDRAFT_929541 [Aspergillus glaucus CBS 516.65]
MTVVPADPVQVHWVIRDKGPGTSWMAPPGSFLPNKQPVPSDQAASTRSMSLLNPCLNELPKTVSLVPCSNQWGWTIRIEGSWSRRLIQGSPLGRLWLRRLWESSARNMINAAQYDSDSKMQKLRPATNILDCGSAIGIANHANFWDTIRASNVHVHRSNISAISEGRDDAVVHLSNGERMHSVDLVVHATGWKPAVPVHFEPTSLGVSFGLPCQSPLSNKRSHDGADTRYWHGLDVATESRLRKIHKKDNSSVNERPIRRLLSLSSIPANSVASPGSRE